jgi:hypothetical protein
MTPDQRVCSVRRSRRWLRTSYHMPVDALADTRDGLRRLREDGRNVMPHVRHVLPQRTRLLAPQHNLHIDDVQR